MVWFCFLSWFLGVELPPFFHFTTAGSEDKRFECLQVALLGTQIWWTTEVNIAFSRLEEGYENAMKDYYKKQVSVLRKFASIVYAGLGKKRSVALIVKLLNCRYKQHSLLPVHLVLFEESFAVKQF